MSVTLESTVFIFILFHTKLCVEKIAYLMQNIISERVVEEWRHVRKQRFNVKF